MKSFCWIVADEVYAQLVYDERPAAPSFLELATPDDALVVVNSFSKAWAMTGWRIGWMIMPARLTEVVDKLIEFNTSGAQPFLQRGCVAAIQQGEPFVAEMVARYRAGTAWSRRSARAVSAQVESRFCLQCHTGEGRYP